ncbi:MAG TPA: response regulator transcription factor [Anaerolineae bacterium]|nr:response regulator transcription factor [Anaerolineae bacterium]
MRITVLLADDHKIMRDGLRSLIEREPDMEVVGEAADGRRTVQLVRELSPDVVIMDVTMPHLNGLEATRQIVAEAPKVKVIALSMHSDSRFVAGMLRAGGSGYLLKDCAFEELVHAIRTVTANQAYLSPAITGIVVEDYVRRVPPRELSAFSVLTPREREVLQLLAEGQTTRGIASRLHTSVKTIETHRRHIMGKLDISGVAELTKYAIREGLTSLDI